MKRQTLLQLVIFLAMFLVSLGILAWIRFQVTRGMGSTQQTVSLGACSLRIPGTFGVGRPYKDQAWETQEYRGNNTNTLRLATSASDGTPWEALCMRYFEMPTYPAGPFRFQSGKARCFFKEIPLCGKGAYVLQKRGTRLRFIAFFEHEGVRHWISLDTWNAFAPQKEVFDNMLRSLTYPNGTTPDTSLDAALRPMLRESDYQFVQPLEIFLLVPAAAMALIFIIQALIRRRAGRLPETALLSTHPPLFSEGRIELGLASSFQRKYMDCAVTVTPEALTVYTFGTPFLTLPRHGLRACAEVGQAWLGLPFVKLALERPPVFLKWGAYYRRLRGPLTLRIYTQDAQRILNLL